MRKKNDKIWRACKVAAAVVLLSGLTACASPLTGIVKVAMENFSEPEEDFEGDNIEIRELEVRKIEPDSHVIQAKGEEITDEDVPLENSAVQDSYQKERLDAYVSVLEGIYYHQIYPDGQEIGLDGELENLSENHFAIYDVDGDGKDELTVEITTTYMAGMCETIYDYDETSHIVRDEFSEFPALTIYSNGIIKAEWSHNQGLSGDFWPYNLYQYQPETDTYKFIGEVDAWDKNCFAKDYEGNLFPDALDRDGNGLIYYISTDQQDRNTIPVDDEEYNQWINMYINNGKEISLPLRNLTEENIQLLTN